ncbi:MAG TPA: SDR family NAD(P)-dependent oxidoreductase [Streptosporangiaceae bacterium]|nr:SDR family NAD(P)-dependent oxidoreductase [Streptosporangiaceae bacterium]
MASIAAFEPDPKQAVYGATKAYVLSLTEAMPEELRGSGVQVSRLAPGPTETEWGAQAGMLGTRLFRLGVLDASRVARAGHDGLRLGKTVVIPGLNNRILALAVRLTPRFLVCQDLCLPAGIDPAALRTGRGGGAGARDRRAGRH